MTQRWPHCRFDLVTLLLCLVGGCGDSAAARESARRIVHRVELGGVPLRCRAELAHTFPALPERVRYVRAATTCGCLEARVLERAPVEGGPPDVEWERARRFVGARPARAHSSGESRRAEPSDDDRAWPRCRLTRVKGRLRLDIAAPSAAGLYDLVGWVRPREGCAYRVPLRVTVRVLDDVGTEEGKR